LGKFKTQAESNLINKKPRVFCFSDLVRFYPSRDVDEKRSYEQKEAKCRQNAARPQQFAGKKRANVDAKKPVPS